MLTVQKLRKMLLELLALKEIGCTYDFKERFEVALTPLEVLGLVKVIRTKIPDCGDHCERYNNCQWIPIFQKSKSKSKFSLTKEGLALAENLSSESISDSEALAIISDYLLGLSIIDQIISLLLGAGTLSIEKLVSTLLKEINLDFLIIRTTLRDILDLLVSTGTIGIYEGTIITVN